MKSKLQFAALFAMVLIGSVQAKVIVREIDYKAGETPMHGYLAYDDAKTGKLPGVLVVHEWWGNNDYAKSRAQDLAHLGYVAFALDMYGEGKVTKDATQAGEWAGAVKNNPQLARERAEAAIEVLKQQPNVNPDKIGAIGYCFGGWVVLHMARWDLPVQAVVSFHGDLTTAAPAQKVTAKILVCNGQADPFVPAEQVSKFKAEMAAASADARIIDYPNAKHSFTNPKADEHQIEGVAYQQAADQKSWEDMRAFFRDVLGGDLQPAR